MRRKDNTTAYLLLIPALLLFGMFTLYPFLYGLFISLHRWDGFSDMVFIGFSNYQRVLGDPDFANAFKNNVLYAVGSVTGKITLSLIIALLLNRSFRGLTFFRGVFFVPVVLSFIAVGSLWQRIYDPVLGILNVFLLKTSIISEPILWLADPTLAIWSLVMVDIWKWAGYHAVLFLAGLQTIPADLYEAASVDGANRFSKFIYITVANLKSILLMNITIALMGAFSVFDLVHIMTRGGPYKSTEVMLTYMYTKTFDASNSNFGFGSSVAYLLFVIILVITVVQSRAMNKAEE